jgi:hypothetical protein
MFYKVPRAQGMHSLKGGRHLLQRVRHFAMGKITIAIYSGNLFLAYYNRYVKEERANDIYDCTSMNQLLEVSLEQLFKKDPKQRASLNWIVNQCMDTQLFS